MTLISDTFTTGSRFSFKSLSVRLFYKHPKPVSRTRSTDSSPKSQLIKNGKFMERVAAAKYIRYGPCQNYRSSAGSAYQMT